MFYSMTAHVNYSIVGSHLLMYVPCRVKYASLYSALNLLAQSKHQLIYLVLRVCLHYAMTDLPLGFVGRASLSLPGVIYDMRGRFSRLHVSFDRQKAIRVSGMSERAYVRSLTAMQNALGLR